MFHTIQRGFARILKDITEGRNLEAYVVSGIGVVLLFLDIIGNDFVTTDVKLTVMIAALVVLVFRSTKPEETEIDLDTVLLDRQSYGPFREFITDARELFIFGPSAINVLRDPSWMDILERGGKVKVIIQNPNETHTMNQLKQQLDQIFNLENDIKQSVDILRRIRRMHEKLEFRFIDYNPGFSMTVVDPDGRNGHLVIEFFGYQNPNIKSRMHINIARTQTAFWFEYWEAQFRTMWDRALPDEQVFGAQDATSPRP